MPVGGRRPKAGPTRHRNKPTYDWVEVVDQPYDGEVPPLPRRASGSWSAATKRWWGVISRMPHCALWNEADWQFALETLAVYDAFRKDPGKYSNTLLAREKLLGTTLDFRRDLRIRYVDPDEESETEDASVTIMADYQAAIASGE